MAVQRMDNVAIVVIVALAERIGQVRKARGVE
ncbi:hypothetical protein QFZ71_001593 [Streptomyces sp. V2I9]|nr:hypothetical protein [Streptomyces sp. V2I9]